MEEKMNWKAQTVNIAVTSVKTKGIVTEESEKQINK